MELLEVTFSRHGTCKLLCDTSLALASSSPTRLYTGNMHAICLLCIGTCSVTVHSDLVLYRGGQINRDKVVRLITELPIYMRS